MKRKLLSLSLVLGLLMSLLPAMTVGTAAASQIKAYVTVSFDGSIIQNSGKSMIDVPVTIDSGSTVQQAIEAAVTEDGYTLSPFTYSSYGYFSTYSGNPNNSTPYDLGSAVNVNGKKTDYGTVSGTLIANSTIDVALFSNRDGYPAKALYFGDASGTYSSTAAVAVGGTSPVTAYYNTAVTAGGFFSDYGNFSGGTVSDDAIVTYYTMSDGVYTATATPFASSGTVYAVATADNCAPAAAVISVKNSVTETAPTLKTGVSSEATASTYTGNPYSLNLSNIFEDANGDTLSYYAKVDSGSFTLLSGSSYSYTPTASGTFILTFKANDRTNDSPTYTVTLTANDAPVYESALSGLSAYYSSLISYADSNDQWGLASLMAYDTTILTGTQKQLLLEQLIHDAYAAYKSAQSLNDKDYTGANTCASTLARCIIALKSIGYDAQNMRASDGTAFNAVAAMNSLTDKVGSYAYCIYTQPYMLMALQEFGTSYSSQLTKLKSEIMSAALASGGWGYSSGTDVLDSDTFAPIILAMSPYYSDTATYTDRASVNKTIGSEIDACISQSVISGMQSSTGAIYSWGSDNVYDTGLVMAALVSVGKNPADYTNSGKSLVNGLELHYNDANCYGNSLANDQTFRGLTAYSHYSGSSWFRLYDFSSESARPAYSGVSFNYCPVYFDVYPYTSTVTVTGQTAVTGNAYDLNTGTYSYSVSCNGYTSSTGSFTVASADISAGTKTISVTLSKASSGSVDLSATVSVKGYGGASLLSGSVITAQTGASAWDVIKKALDKAGISYVVKSTGVGAYISSVNGLAEFDKGANSGWQYSVNGTLPGVSISSYTLSGGENIVLFYTSDYTADSSTSTASTDKTKDIGEVKSYGDVGDVSWFSSAVSFVSSKGIMGGTSETSFAPNESMSRAMLVTVLYRLEGKPTVTGGSGFTDVQSGQWYSDAVSWANALGVISGYGNGLFGTGDSITRENLVMILYNYAKFKNYDVTKAGDLKVFSDAGQIGTKAYDALSWAYAEGLIMGLGNTEIAPDSSATRAQTALVLQRFCEKFIKA